MLSASEDKAEDKRCNLVFRCIQNQIHFHRSVHIQYLGQAGFLGLFTLCQSELMLCDDGFLTLLGQVGSIAIAQALLDDWLQMYERQYY